MPNKLSQFWQELKRRNVVRVITVYAGAAFVILEVVNNIAEPLRLPAWTPTFVIVLLAIGFPIAIIFSWIYDVHPGEGMVKTVPADKVKTEDIHKPSNGWKVASYISFIVILGLIVLNIIPRNGKEAGSVILDKSIAVLPFKNDSPDEEKMYFINGTMDAILDNLCKIADLRVVSRNSVEQYRDNPKPTPVVAEEMKVSYVMEGSGQKIGTRVLLIVQLIDGKTDQHLWSKQYDREIEKIEDLIDIQTEIARLVAAEIKAVITPEEKELIEKMPTTSLTAYDFYQRGRDEEWNDNNDRAEELYHKALEIDPAFASAYNGLARVYRDKHRREEYLSENFLDSVLILTDIAQSLDPKLSETYVIKGQYYNAHNNPEQAIIEFNKAIQLNPNDWEAYMGKAGHSTDPREFIETMYKSLSLNRGPGLPFQLFGFSYVYSRNGFDEQCKKYAREYLDLSGDSAGYYYLIAGRIHTDKQIEFLLKAYRQDSTRRYVIYDLGEAYLFLRNYEESLKYFEKYPLESAGSTIGFHRIGLAYLYNGDKEKADYYFDKEDEISLAEIDLGRQSAVGSLYSYLDLASVYAIRGEKERALEYLRMFDQKESFTLHILSFMYTDPSFDNIRDEPEFQEIVRDMEAKYQANYDIIQKWLEENDML